MQRVWFISGHLDLTLEEFLAHYVPQFEAALDIDPNSAFVVGDAGGADTAAQGWLKTFLQDGQRNVIVYHMFESPRNNVGGFPTRGGFINDDERDAAMTADSTDDIAWVRPGRERSGTAKNLKRRAREQG